MTGVVEVRDCRSVQRGGLEVGERVFIGEEERAR